MERWIGIKSNPSEDYDFWSRQLGVTPLCARLIANRGAKNVIDAKRYMNGHLGDLHSPGLLPDVDKAVAIIHSHVEKNSLIAIAGDYDVDGVTSILSLYKPLKAIGARVTYRVPNRIQDGYGLNEKIVRELSAEGVNLIITCDNGIAAAHAVDVANSLGIDVVITDHHLPPLDDKDNEIYPDALAIVDPHIAASKYPFKEICGAEVAFKVMQYYYQKFPCKELETALQECIPFVTMGTICDVMPLCDENRYFVRDGLRAIEKTTNKGLRALIVETGLGGRKINTHSVGFILGPSINATGRLTSATEAVDLFLCEDSAECVERAKRICELNASRKNMTEQGIREALEYIKKNDLLKQKVLVLYLPDLHESVAGLVAGKIKEKFTRPTYVIARADKCLKGSGRSIPAYDMYAHMHAVKDLFLGFGGHKLAAGFSLEASNLPKLKKALETDSGLTDTDIQPTVSFDAIVPMSDITLDVVRGLECLEPIGTGNPGVTFVGLGLKVKQLSRMGKHSEYGDMIVESNGKTCRMVYFGDMDAFDSFLDRKYGFGTRIGLYSGSGEAYIDACYEATPESYNGRESVSYKLKSWK